MMSGFLANCLRFAGRTLQSAVNTRQFHAIPVSQSVTPVKPTISSIWSAISVRTIIRNNFPVARETKRVLVLGWKTKHKTKNGRRQIMRRILKGRYYLTH